MPSPAHAEFVHGPYDGLVIDVDDVERFVGEDAVQESYDNRLFLLMPPLLDWDRIVEGKADRDGCFERPHPYEVSPRPGRLNLVYCGLSRFQEAMGDREAL